MATSRDERYTEPERRALRTALARPPHPGGPRNAGEIVGAARAAVGRLRVAGVPDYLHERLRRLDEIVRMVNDRGFDLPIDPRLQALVALRYFAESKDPALRDASDELDDALIIDLVSEQLAHQLAGYREFCAFRRETAPRRGFDARRFTRKQWFAERRKALEEQLRERTRQAPFVTDGVATAERFQIM